MIVTENFQGYSNNNKVLFYLFQNFYLNCLKFDVESTTSIVQTPPVTVNDTYELRVILEIFIHNLFIRLFYKNKTDDT